VRRQTYGSPPFDRYQIILLGKQRHVCVNNLPKTVPEITYRYGVGWDVKPYSLTVSIEHCYRLHGGMLPETERSMTFYHVARVDGLERRVETSTQMTEHFINRDDFLVYRLIEFTGRQKKFGPSEHTSERPIQVLRHQRMHEPPSLRLTLDICLFAFIAILTH